MLSYIDNQPSNNFGTPCIFYRLGDVATEDSANTSSRTVQSQPIKEQQVIKRVDGKDSDDNTIPIDSFQVTAKGDTGDSEYARKDTSKLKNEAQTSRSYKNTKEKNRNYK